MIPPYYPRLSYKTRVQPHPARRRVADPRSRGGRDADGIALVSHDAHQRRRASAAGAIPGHEFSGVVAAVGADVSGVAVGDEVYGMNDWFGDGATAEYCLARPRRRRQAGAV